MNSCRLSKAMLSGGGMKGPSYTMLTRVFIAGVLPWRKHKVGVRGGEDEGGRGRSGVCNAAGGPCKGGRPCDVSIDVSRCVIITAAAAAAHYSSNNSKMSKYSMHRSYSSLTMLFLHNTIHWFSALITTTNPSYLQDANNSAIILMQVTERSVWRVIFQKCSGLNITREAWMF